VEKGLNANHLTMLAPRAMIEAAKTPGNRLFALLLAGTIVLQLGKIGAFAAAGQAPLQADALTYWYGGQRIVDGDWLLLRDPAEVARTPGYLLYVAFFQATCGDRALAAAIVAQHLLLFGGSLLACRACWQLTRTRSAVLLCLALSLSCISAHGVAVCLLSDTLFSFLLTLCVACMTAWFQSPSAARAVAIGAALGAAIMVKSAAQLAWAPVVAAMLLTVGRGLSFRNRVAHAGFVLAAVGLVVGPWLIRNQVYFGSPFLTKFAGRSLWWSCFRDGPAGRFNSPLSFADDGAATRAIRQAVPEVDPHDTWKVYKELVGRGYSQIDADELMLRAAKEGIAAHPWDYARNRAVRAVWFWITPNGTFRPNTGDFRLSPSESADPAKPFESDEYAGQAAWKSNWYFTRGGLNFLWHPHPLLYALAASITLAALIFLLRTPACRGPAIFLGLWLAYFSAVTVLAASPEYRYRMILEPAMIVIVVVAWCRYRATKSGLNQ
jgi:4-amino-4-deoxy-L-arabinose transferase-like glycosyltransferase